MPDQYRQLPAVGECAALGHYEGLFPEADYSSVVLGSNCVQLQSQ